MVALVRDMTVVIKRSLSLGYVVQILVITRNKLAVKISMPRKECWVGRSVQIFVITAIKLAVIISMSKKECWVERPEFSSRNFGRQ